MEEDKKPYSAHCIILPFPAQGHINPLLQFSKGLHRRGIKVTLVTTRFLAKTITSKLSSTSISLETISDGYDDDGIDSAESAKAYFDTIRKVGFESLTDLVEKMNSSSSSSCPVNCIVYDTHLPWCLQVARKFGLVGAAFLTQSCAVDVIYYHVNRGVIKLPLKETEILAPGLPPLHPHHLPSFLYQFGNYPAEFELVVDQFSNIDKADCVLCNTFYELEKEAADWVEKQWPLKTVGPTIPSMYLDKKLEDDKDYGFSFFKPNNDAIMPWLDDKPKGSVAYISFGSLATLGVDQMEELSWGLRMSNSYFLWVVRESEELKLPKNFMAETKEKGLVVRWCSQLEVLEHEAVGCFVTHCGWNSTLEALSLGVAMVAMPQWTDQTTNAKYIADVWRVGVRIGVDEKGIGRRESVRDCIRSVMEGESREEINVNVKKWKNLAQMAASEGGSSDRNINEFVANLIASR